MKVTRRTFLQSIVAAGLASYAGLKPSEPEGDPISLLQKREITFPDKLVGRVWFEDADGRALTTRARVVMVKGRGPLEYRANQINDLTVVDAGKLHAMRCEFENGQAWRFEVGDGGDIIVSSTSVCSGQVVSLGSFYTGTSIEVGA